MQELLKANTFCSASFVISGGAEQSETIMKTIHLIECDKCHGSFSENLMASYGEGSYEAVLCETCAGMLEAQLEAEYA